MLNLFIYFCQYLCNLLQIWYCGNCCFRQWLQWNFDLFKHLIFHRCDCSFFSGNISIFCCKANGKLNDYLKKYQTSKVLQSHFYKFVCFIWATMCTMKEQTINSINTKPHLRKVSCNIAICLLKVHVTFWWGTFFFHIYILPFDDWSLHSANYRWLIKHINLCPCCHN